MIPLVGRLAREVPMGIEATGGNGPQNVFPKAQA